MSDFLERLAVRAIGHEPMLAPRLPSLFEPAQQATVMPPHDDPIGERDNRHEMDTPGSGTKAAMHAMKPISAARELVEPLLRTVPRHDKATTSVPMPSEPAHELLSPVSIEPARTTLAADSAPAVTASASLSSQTTSPPVQPRELPVSSTRPEPVMPRTSIGALVPAPPTGIAASRTADAGARVRNATAARQDRVATESTRSLANEPVVHVSIGRIEVRAAPSIVAPARTRDAARSGGLDDHLRRRGGKTPS